jgi:hypothetical protein
VENAVRAKKENKDLRMYTKRSSPSIEEFCIKGSGTIKMSGSKGKKLGRHQKRTSGKQVFWKTSTNSVRWKGICQNSPYHGESRKPYS